MTDLKKLTENDYLASLQEALYAAGSGNLQVFVDDPELSFHQWEGNIIKVQELCRIFQGEITQFRISFCQCLAHENTDKIIREWLGFSIWKFKRGEGWKQVHRVTLTLKLFPEFQDAMDFVTQWLLVMSERRAMNAEGRPDVDDDEVL